MDYFSPQVILIAGMIIGAGLVLSIEMAIHEARQSRRGGHRV